MKRILAKNLFVLFIIFFGAPGIIMATGETSQKEEVQGVVSKDDTAIKEKQVSSEKDDFDFGPLINMFGIFVSASLIIYQLGRHHKNTLELQRENNREKLKLELYEKYRKTISEASDKVHSQGTKARIILTHFNIYVDQLSKGIIPLHISDREPAFREAHFAAMNSLTGLIFLLEEYEIINPNLEIFRTAFSYANHRLTEAYKAFQQILLEFLPHDVPIQDQAKVGTDVTIPKVPSRDDLKKISEVTQSYIDAAMDAGCYISDLSIEAQNIFLGSLFSHRLQHRKPLDPKCHVISTAPDEVAKLKKYFMEETEWGKNVKKVEEEIKQKVTNEQENS